MGEALIARSQVRIKHKKVRQLYSVTRSRAMLVLAVKLLLAYASLCTPQESHAFSKTTGQARILFISRALTYFVAVDGSDAGPGTANQPWATINHAAEQVKAGDVVVVRGGRYILKAQVQLRHAGRSDAWITFAGYPGEIPVFDAQLVPYSSLFQGDIDNGVFQIEGASYIRVANFKIINSHDAGFTVRDSSHIELINNSTQGTFSSGIAVWDTNHGGKTTKHIKIIGNTIRQATTSKLAPAGMPMKSEPPQEALSIGGAIDFEVAYNHIYNSGKEGIDIKETSKHGQIHHNLIDSTLRQGIYVDAWFGEVRDIEIFSNVVHRCGGAGLVLSVENGLSVNDINIHNNLIFDNDGTGLYFSRWGIDNIRRNIQISNNAVYHNGYGPPAVGQKYYWLTGGLLLSSANVRDILISKNIFSDNRAFQIGYSDFFMQDHRSWQAAAHKKHIYITANLIDGRNPIGSPIESGGALRDRVKIYPINGKRAIFNHPLFNNVAKQDFSMRLSDAAAMRNVLAGVYPKNLWWKQNFPPMFFRIRFK